MKYRKCNSIVPKNEESILFHLRVDHLQMLCHAQPCMSFFLPGRAGVGMMRASSIKVK